MKLAAEDRCPMKLAEKDYCPARSTGSTSKELKKARVEAYCGPGEPSVEIVGPKWKSGVPDSGKFC